MVGAGAGALFGYLITATAQGTILGALAIACFGGANALVAVLKPALPVALLVAAVAGSAGGMCLLGSLASAQPTAPPAWVGAAAGSGIGVAEVLLWWWRRRGVGAGRVAEG